MHKRMEFAIDGRLKRFDVEWLVPSQFAAKHGHNSSIRR